MKRLFKEKWPFLLKLRVIWGLILLLLLGLIFYFKIIPGGEITYSRNSWSHSKFLGKGFIYNFSPADRIDVSFKRGARLIGDPVYFSVATPRTFDKAKVTVVYKNNLQIDTPIIETGVLVDKTVWRYELQPLSNKTLDYLSLRSFKIEEDGILLLQTKNNYNTWSEFENDLASGQLKDCRGAVSDCLAVYNYSPIYPFRLANYRRSLPVVLNKTLRGAHQFYTYLENEKLHLEFDFIDLNISSKASPIEVILSADGNVIASQKLIDENLPSTSLQKKEKHLILEKSDLPSGVYKVEVKISDDILIKKISSSLNRLVFINKIRLDVNSSPLIFYTDSNYLQVKAFNPASRQTIEFGNEIFNLSDAYRQIDFETSSSLPVKEIKLNKGEIVLENNGIFSWQNDNLFNPSFKKIDRFFSVSEQPLYIVSRYQKPLEKEGVTTATAELNLKSAYREKGQYSFMISVPGLKAEDEIYDNLEIYTIKIEFEGRTLWQKLRAW